MEVKKVAYEPMNEVHDKEIKILEKLLKKLEMNEDYAKEYQEFLDDVKNHFSFEERLMQKYDFFAYIPHKMEHDKIINELEELQNKDIKTLKQYFYERFLPWLDNHINTMDTVTAGFFNTINVKE